MKSMYLFLAMTLATAAAAATAVDPATLTNAPGVVIANTSHESSRTTQVKDLTSIAGACLRLTAEKNGTWDNQWDFAQENIAAGVPYDIYIVMKFRKTGEEGDALGFGLYDQSAKLINKDTLVPAKEVKNMTWQAWKICTFTHPGDFGGYVYGGIVFSNGANIPEAWFDRFIAVPLVNAQTEPLINALKEKRILHEKAVAELNERLKKYPVLQPQRLLGRFAFGVYYAYEQLYESAELFGEKWQDRFERSCEDFVRCYMNSVPIVNSPWFDNPKMDDLVRIAGETGVDIMPGQGGLPAGVGFVVEQEQRFVPMVKRYADKPALLTWYLWDEPEPRWFLPILNARLICDSISPDKSATLIPSGMKNCAFWGQYFPVFMPDCYPVQYNNRDPWQIGAYTRMCIEKTGRPIWMMHQNYGCLTTNKTATARPTIGEFRLMSYLAVAEGASGLMPYHYYGKSGWMVERYVARGTFEQTFINGFEVHDELWPIHKEIGRRMSAVGPLLLGAKYLASEGLTITAPEITIAKEQKARALIARKLEAPSGETYIVVVNNDPNRTTQGEVKVENLKGGLFDLFEMQAAPAPNGALNLTLQPGDAKILLAGSGEQFKKVSDLIQNNRCRQEGLIAQLEIRTARKMKVDPGQAESQLAEADGKLKAGEASAALALYLKAAQSAAAAIEADKDLAAAKKNLAEAQAILGKLDDRFEESPLLFVAESRLKARQLFFDTGKEYFRLLNLLRGGDRRIAPETEALVKQAALLEEKIFGNPP